MAYSRAMVTRRLLKTSSATKLLASKSPGDSHIKRTGVEDRNCEKKKKP